MDQKHQGENTAKKDLSPNNLKNESHKDGKVVEKQLPVIKENAQSTSVDKKSVQENKQGLQSSSVSQSVEKLPSPTSGSDRETLLAKIQTLENKVSYYENEQQNYQNQLLSQRQSYEEEIMKLKNRLQENQHQGTAKEYALELYEKSESEHLKTQLQVLSKENDDLKKETDRLQQVISDIKHIGQKMLEQESSSNAPLSKLEIVALNIEIDIKSSSETKVTPGAGEEGYQDKLQKLQKKITEFETYLEEKDKALLEQEQQLTVLQDQVHEYIKNEDKFKTQVKQQQIKIDELMRELKLIKEKSDYKINELHHQLQAKDNSLTDAWQLASDKELEIKKNLLKIKEAEDAAKEYRGDYQSIQEENQQLQQRMQENMEENEQIKQDFQKILNYKNELEILIDEQTQHIEMKNKKMHMLEETLRFKESELEKKDSILRRMTTGADEMKKKLSQAEMKLRQITQTTIRDMKIKMKDQTNEIEVLKEMVKSSNKAAKAKDIDIQRLNKKIQRLEKFADLNKGMLSSDAIGGSRLDDNKNVIAEENENLEQEDYLTPNRQRIDLGLNPAIYSVEDEVQMELLQAQQQRQFNIKASVKKSNMPNNNYRNLKQREIEEAMELDRMLEQERRNLSQDIFQKKYDEKFDSYFNNINVPNYKNQSSGMRGVFGGGSTDDSFSRAEASRYDGLLPNLNLSKKEQLEKELMNEINNESIRKDKYMTPNLQGKQKIVNKLNAAAYANNKQGSAHGNNSGVGGGGTSNAPYFHERNSAKINKKLL